MPLGTEERRLCAAVLGSEETEGRFSNRYCAYEKNDVTAIYGSVLTGRVAKICLVAAKRSS